MDEDLRALLLKFKLGDEEELLAEGGVRSLEDLKELEELDIFKLRLGAPQAKRFRRLLTQEKRARDSEPCSTWSFTTSLGNATLQASEVLSSLTLKFFGLFTELLSMRHESAAEVSSSALAGPEARATDDTDVIDISSESFDDSMGPLPETKKTTEKKGKKDQKAKKDKGERECVADPPRSLELAGDLQDRKQCLGKYVLVPHRRVHGYPVWKQTRVDRWIAKEGGDLGWVVQSEASLGKNQGWLFLDDASVMFPHLSSVSWQGPQLVAGARVRLHSLQSASDRNGYVGKLVSFDREKGRWEVNLETMPPSLLSLKPANLELISAADLERKKNVWKEAPWLKCFADRDAVGDLREKASRPDGDEGVKWKKSGSRYLGQRVRRTVYPEVGGESNADATVVAWLPAEEVDFVINISKKRKKSAALWRIAYDDEEVGEEDLEEFEVQQAITAFKAADSEEEDSGEEEDDDDEEDESWTPQNKKCCTVDGKMPIALHEHGGGPSK